MATQSFDDSDYPYASKPAVVLGPAKTFGASAARSSWRVWFGVALRLGLVVGACLALVAISVVVIVYRARSQAAVIAELEACGCDIGYEYMNGNDPGTPLELLQEVFGNEYFGNVDTVSALRLNNTEQVAAVCRRCTRFSKLTSFSIQNDAFEFEQIANWPQLNQLTALSIESNQLTDDDLAEIARMEQLGSLALSSSQITEAGIHHLSRMPELWSLTLLSAPLPGKDSRNEWGFPKLTHLMLKNRVKVRDQTIINLGPLPELTIIDFDNTNVGDEAVNHVTRGGRLTYAAVRGTKITDRGLGYLARCKNLSYLTVSNTAVTDEGIRKLEACSYLNFIDAAETKITGNGWNVLRGAGLTLVLNRTELDDDGLKDVLSISGLGDVSAVEAKVTGTGTSRLSELEHVSLNLHSNPLTLAGIQVLAKARASSLTLSKTPLDDKGLMLFVDNDNIGDLDVSETKVTSAGVVAFYEARKRRLEGAGQRETLALSCDFSRVVEPYLPKDEFHPGGVPSEFPLLEREQQSAVSEQPSPSEQAPAEPSRP